MARLIDATRIEQYILNNCSDNEEINAIYGEIINAPTVEAEPTFEQIEEYCRKRCLVVVDGALFNEMKSRWSAEPVKHGHWIKSGGEYICSNCREWCVVNEEHNPVRGRYCINCGAKMDGGENEIDRR